MKTLISALALTFAATPALAQSAAAPAQDAPRPVAAAATLPNAFDGPAAAAAPQDLAPPPAPAAEIGPDVKRAEDALRAVVAGIQQGDLNYAMFSQGLADRIRAQAATIDPLIKGFGELVDVTYVGQEQGAELFALDFEKARTQWIIGFNAEDEIALLLFRPAPTGEPAAPAPSPPPAAEAPHQH